MASGTAPAEPITAEPVIVEESDAPKLTGDALRPEPAVDKTPARAAGEEAAEDEDADIHIRRGGRGRRRGRSYTPSPPRFLGRATIREIRDNVVLLKNANSLNDLVLEPMDGYWEASASLQRGSYITSYAFHQAGVENISWLLTMGMLDAWVQRPLSHSIPQGFQFELPPEVVRRPQYYDSRYGGAQDPVPLARLGSAFRVFKNDSDEYMTSKVKFVVAVQATGCASWYKLAIGHSRQTALATIYHEMLNSNSIAFVGAVLQEASIPVGFPTKLGVKLKKANSIRELEEMEEGVIGIIC